jgi:hypothetical protein
MSIFQKIQEKGASNDEILQIFRDAQKELIDIVQNQQGGSFSRFQKQQIRAIGFVISKLEVKAFTWAERSLPPIMNAGAKETFEQIKEFEEDEDFAVRFVGVPEEAVKSLIQEAFLDFGTTITGLQRDATRAAIEKRRIQERVIKGFIQGASTSRTQNEIVKDLKEQGFTVLKAKNGFGRKFSLEAYSNLLVRTQNVTAYNLGAKNQLLASGRRFAVFPTLRPDIDGNDVCNEWEERRYIDLLQHAVPPASTHPNCRHTIQPVSFDELQKERPGLYAKAVAYFNRIAEQS